MPGIKKSKGEGESEKSLAAAFWARDSPTLYYNNSPSTALFPLLITRNKMSGLLLSQKLSCHVPVSCPLGAYFHR